MPHTHPASKGKYVVDCRKDLELARESCETARISLAAANLGYALFQVKKYQEGLDNFDEAIQLAFKMGDISLKVRCLGIKILAFQSIGRLPDAYEVAGEILTIAEEILDLGMKVDALTSQGQILLDSGEPIIAYEHLSKAELVARQINDPHRLMNVMGILGNYSLAIAAGEKAETYFGEALSLARKSGDRESEIGFLGNLGIVFEWKGNYYQAIQNFMEVLKYMQDKGDVDAEIQVLRHLTKNFDKLQDDESIFLYAQRGIDLAGDRQDNTIYVFFEFLILANYRKGYREEAHRITSKAIQLAQARKDDKEEMNFLLSLGESYMLAEMYEKSLEVYMQAREKTKQLDRPMDDAYLAGRIGVVMAELNRMDEAIKYHKEAVELAHQNGIAELEGEQLSMLAIAYLDMDQTKDARLFCQSAIDIFSNAGLEQEENNARVLLSEIDNCGE